MSDENIQEYKDRIAELEKELKEAKEASQGDETFDELKKKYEVCRSTLLTSMAEHHKEDALHNYGGIVTVKYFSDYTYRIIVFAPDTEYYEYMLEMFDLKTCRWVASFDRPIGSKNLSRLFDDIEERFNDVILID